MEKGTDALAGGRRGRGLPRSPSRSSCPSMDCAVIRGAPGRHGGGPGALRAGGRASSASSEAELLEHLESMQERARAAPRGGDPVPPPGRLLGQRHGRLERARGADHRARPADGLLPRHLALLPAPDLRGLALLGVHDGPRALQGGVRRHPRLDRRGHRHRGPAHALLLHRVQEDPAALLHRRAQGSGKRSTRHSRLHALGELYARARRSCCPAA